jgi:hypothetical protein
MSEEKRYFATDAEFGDELREQKNGPRNNPALRLAWP